MRRGMSRIRFNAGLWTRAAAGVALAQWTTTEMPPIEFYCRHATVANLRKGQFIEVRCGFRFCRHVGAVTPG
jgi:hypothetical protein